MLDFVVRKRKIEEQFHRLVEQRQTFYVLDTETTGLGYDAEACEIAVIDQDGNRIIDTFIKTTKPIPEQASKIHGIYNNDVASAPTWDKIVPELRSVLKGKTVLIYNSEYDVKIINTCNRLYGIQEPIGAVGKCVMKAFAEWNGAWDDYRESYKWVKLSEAASMLKLDVSKVVLHRAIGDCQLTLGVVKELAMRVSQDGNDQQAAQALIQEGGEKAS